jgi:hypothetical protein
MADPLIELNTGASSNSNDLGLIMERGSTGNNAMFIWDESNDGFAVGTTTATGASTGNISFSAAPFTASTITGTVLTGSTSVKTPLIEYTDGDDAITIADGGHITTGGNLSIGGSNNELRFYEGSNYVGFEAPALSANKIWVLPSADGSANQILKTDGSGNLSFTDDLTLAAATVNNYTGNGSTTAYTLSTTPNLETSIQAYVDGVYQFKNTFSFSGTTFTFDTAPDNGALIEILVWNTVAVNVPAASSVTNTTLNASIITGQTVATAVDADHVLIYDASATALRKALVSDLQQTDEEIQDLIGAMFSSNTETGISVTYQDGDGTLDLVIGDDTIVSSMLDTNIDIAGTLDVTGVLTTDTNAIVAGTLGIAGGSTNGVAISQGAIAIKNGGSKSYIDLYCESSNAHYTRIEAAAHSAYSGNVTATLPTTTGTLALTSDIHTTEELQDIIGAMVSSNTESGITVAYQDADGTIDFTVGTLNQNTTGTAATVTTAAQTNITSVGTLTALTVDDITINGSVISDGGALDITSGADMLLDSEGDIIFDANGANFKFKDDNTAIFELNNSSGDLEIFVNTADKDIKFGGNDSGSTITAMTIDMSAAGAVGIGTTSPSAKLDVVTNDNVYAAEFIQSNTSNGDGAYVQIGSTAAVDYAFNVRSNAGNTQIIAAKGDGKVGIGTASPVRVLQVGTHGTGNGEIALGSATNGVGSILFGDGASGGDIYRGYVQYNHTDEALLLATNAAERMRIVGNNVLLTGGNDARIVFGTGGAGAAIANDASWVRGEGDSLIYNAAANGHHKYEINGSEKLRIDSSGKVGIGASSPTHQLDVEITATNTPTARFLNKGNVTGYTNIVAVDTWQSNSVNHQYLVLSSGNGSAVSDNEFNFRGDGQAYADGAWNGGGADYAEYFEWNDGNSGSQDRVGYSVSLVDNKIKIAESSETVIGVISGNPAVVGDNSWNSWKDKYQKDDYGRYIRNSDGHRIPNTDYDDTVTYVNREDRKEWDIVGLMGKLRIKKGQQTGTNWIKMRDISATVEEWLVK